MNNKKLIEVALPLEIINKESSREKSIRFGHPSTLHLWWARRPLAAARAVIWASIIDDPSAHPEKFPTEEDQIVERKRLFKIIEDFVSWENTTNEEIFSEARKEMEKAVEGELPVLLDPFAGGGTIPLEAQRLGLHVRAHDLNPVAVIINKATIEIPPLFANRPPVNPEVQATIDGVSMWSAAEGLAVDIKYYGELLKQKVFEKIGSNYPKVTISSKSGEKATVIAWVWSRVGKCQNPLCGCEVPFASSFVLSKKKGNEAWVEPVYIGKKLKFVMKYGKCPKDKASNKMGRSAIFKCPVCGTVTTDEYVKTIGRNHEIYSKLMGIIAEGPKGRIFVEANPEHELAAKVDRPDEYPNGDIPLNPRWFSPPAFGMSEYADLFTNRQINTLVTFANLLCDVQNVIVKDAVEAGLPEDHIHLKDGGTGATAYGEAIRVYLAFALDREANYSSTLNGWSGDFIIQTFGRQALPMVWDYAETNPFSNSTGNWSGAIKWISLAVERMPALKVGQAMQKDAQSDCQLRNIMVSTDPPYYDNIGYADLSDYFYIWLRYSLREIYPSLFTTMLVPKREELVATPYHFEGDSKKAKDFFEDGMRETCKRIHDYIDDKYPVSIYYAYKQSDTDRNSQTASTGWETMLSAIVNANLVITGTWPIHTERETGLKAHVNALASSIVLICRKRDKSAPQITRRNLVNLLRRELRPALKKLQESNIAPVDMAQSAIGPGMGVFSRYRRVLEADGTPMTVRSALQVINEEIDLYFNEQVGEMDTASRFCVDLYTQNAYNDIKYGEAEVLANAKGTSIPMMASHGVLYAKAGVVHLIDRSELPTKVDMNEGNVWMLTQQLTHAMATGGVEACAQIILNMFGSNAERAKDLAYRLYTIAEQKKWANEAYAYNALVVAWPDIQSRAAALKAVQPKQLSFFDMI